MNIKDMDKNEREKIISDVFSLGTRNLLIVFKNVLEDIFKKDLKDDINKSNLNILSEKTDYRISKTMYISGNSFYSKLRFGSMNLLVIIIYSVYYDKNFTIDNFYILKEENFGYKKLIAFHVPNDESYEDEGEISEDLIREFLINYIDYNKNLSNSKYNDSFYHDFKIN